MSVKAKSKSKMKTEIREINKNLLAELRREIDGLLLEVGKKYDLNLKVGNASYSSTYFTLKVEGSIVAEEGVATTREQLDFKDYAESHGLSPDDLFKTFETNGEAYEIVGLKPRSKKYPIIARVVGTEKRYKFPATSIKLFLGVTGMVVE